MILFISNIQRRASRFWIPPSYTFHPIFPKGNLSSLCQLSHPLFTFHPADIPGLSLSSFPATSVDHTQPVSKSLHLANQSTSSGIPKALALPGSPSFSILIPLFLVVHFFRVTLLIIVFLCLYHFMDFSRSSPEPRESSSHTHIPSALMLSDSPLPCHPTNLHSLTDP